MSDWHSSGFSGDDAGEIDDFVKECDDLLDVLDDLPEKAEDFVDSVRSKVEGMRDWATKNARVTPRMVEAIRNMADGAEKWRR
jgi:hypothetical protein